MKKIIILIIIFIVFIPFCVFAISRGSRCENDSECATEKNDFKCNITVKKCVKIAPQQANPQNAPCIEDDNCETWMTRERTFCSKITWTCNDNKFKEKDAECTREKECNEDYFCKITNNDKLGICTERKNADEYNLCTNAGECDSDLECYQGVCLHLKGGIGTQENDKECKFTKECVPDSYLYCQIVSGQKIGKCAYQKDIHNSCNNQEECKNIYACVNKDGKAIAKGESGTCEQSQKETDKCSDNKPCNNPLICVKTNAIDAEGTCQKQKEESKTEEQKSDEQKAQEAARLGMSYQIDQYCSASRPKGTFTQDVSYACLNCGNCEARDIMAVIARVFNFAFTIIGSLAVLGTIISGMMYILSHGNQEKAEGAKKALTATITGLVIVALAYFLINTIMTLLGYNCGSWFAPNFTCPPL